LYHKFSFTSPPTPNISLIKAAEVYITAFLPRMTSVTLPEMKASTFTASRLLMISWPSPLKNYPTIPLIGDLQTASASQKFFL
ncbi:MAG: hypothetical protein QG670_257, partial [Thermoproteota archaeon]|nr:hypothetical protein [Thermoproteota archaeon]